MKAYERQQKIIEFVEKNREASFHEIHALFSDVSEMTIRRGPGDFKQGRKNHKGARRSEIHQLSLNGFGERLQPAQYGAGGRKEVDREKSSRPDQ